MRIPSRGQKGRAGIGAILRLCTLPTPLIPCYDRWTLPLVPRRGQGKRRAPPHRSVSPSQVRAEQAMSSQPLPLSKLHKPGNGCPVSRRDKPHTEFHTSSIDIESDRSLFSRPLWLSLLSRRSPPAAAAIIPLEGGAVKHS